MAKPASSVLEYVCVLDKQSSHGADSGQNIEGHINCSLN